MQRARVRSTPHMSTYQPQHVACPSSKAWARPRQGMVQEGEEKECWPRSSAAVKTPGCLFNHKILASSSSVSHRSGGIEHARVILVGLLCVCVLATARHIYRGILDAHVLLLLPHCTYHHRLPPRPCLPAATDPRDLSPPRAAASECITRDTPIRVVQPCRAPRSSSSSSR